MTHRLLKGNIRYTFFPNGKDGVVLTKSEFPTEGESKWLQLKEGTLLEAEGRRCYAALRSSGYLTPEETVAACEDMLGPMPVAKLKAEAPPAKKSSKKSTKKKS